MAFGCSQWKIMDLLQQIVLSAVQGITEFLPISSSGHLVLVPRVMDWPDQGLLLDVAVHVGTLMAVVLYFIGDLWRMLVALFQPGKPENKPYVALLFQLVIAALPVVAAGFYFKDYVAVYARALEVVGWTTLLGGVLLYYADKSNMTIVKLDHLTWQKAFFIGVWQILAIIPGVSRSGITMTAARFLGIERTDAARFSMLLSIPTILGAAVLLSRDLVNAEGDLELTPDIINVTLLSFGFALISIWGLMRWLKSSSFTPFVIYRVLLGGGLLYLSYAA